MRTRLTQLEAENKRLQMLAGGGGPAPHETKTFQPSAADVDATLVRTRPIRKDALEDIDGIGPVYAKRLNEAGIYSFAQLAELTAQRVREIINPEEWQKIEPEKWIVQASVMADPDKLEDIIGIGEVYARRLNKAGIYSFAQLAESTPEQIQELIDPEEWLDCRGQRISGSKGQSHCHRRLANDPISHRPASQKV